MRRAPGAWSPRAGRRGGESAVSPTVASRSQGQPREHQRGCRGDVGQVGRGGAYPSGGTAGRQRKNFGAAVFVDGEGAPVVAGGGDEVLQLGRGEGVRGLQEIAGIGSSGRSSPGSGGQRRCSARIRARGGGSGGQRRWSTAGSGGESWALERRSRRGVKTGERAGQ
jgi:hypothetical protein